MIKNETLVNSKDLEFSPVFYKNGIAFISTRYEGLLNEVEDTRIQLNTMSIYRSERDAEGVLQPPYPMGGGLVSSFHEGPVSFNQTAETIYFTRNNTSKPTDKNGLVKLKIYEGSKTGETWGDIKELPFNVDGYNTAHPSLSVDGDKLYYASDREDGFGGMDLYVVEKVGEEWGTPRNLGPSVNTSGNEAFPFIHADGTLYFASTGHGGEGGLDIFYAIEDDNGTWGSLRNLGAPFNTENDDFGFIVDRDNRNGYFSSNRLGGRGNDDIYSFYIYNVNEDDFANVDQDNKNKKAAIVVKDSNGNPIPNAEISYLNLDDIILSDNSANGSGGIIRLGTGENGNDLVVKLEDAQQTNKGLTNAAGQYEANFPQGNYVLKIAKDGYLPQQITFSSKNIPNDLDIVLEKAVDCVPFAGTVLDDIYNRPVAGALIVIKDSENGQEMTLTSDERGQYDYCLKCNRDYTVFAEKNGVKSEIGEISTRDQYCDASLNLGVSLYLSFDATNAPIVVGTVIQLPHIYYNFDDASLRPDAVRDLDVVVDFLNLYPNVNVELASHTDARGSDRYNQKLSQRRSENAVDYIRSRGIANTRINGVGYGESKIRNRCVDGVRCSEAEHQENRRTEIVVTNVDGSVAAASSFANTQTSRASNIGTGSSSAAYNTSNKSDNNEYMVIAGTFRNTDNAEDRLQEIRNLGYANAQVVQLDNSPIYHAVVVEKFYYDRTSADILVQDLKERHRMRAYVRSSGR